MPQQWRRPCERGKEKAVVRAVDWEGGGRETLGLELAGEGKGCEKILKTFAGAAAMQMSHSEG